MDGRVRSVCTRAVAVALLAVAPLLLSDREASAHAELVATDPGNGAHLDRAPSEVVLRFNDVVSPVRDGLRLLDGTGTTVTEVTGRQGPGGASSVSMPLPGSLGDGVYVVSWRVLSVDSHPVHGAFVFSVGSAQAAPLADPGSRAGADRAVGLTFWLARLLGFAGLALLVGGAFFVLACWPAGRTDRGIHRLIRAAWIASMASALAVLLLQGPNAVGSSLVTALDPALLLDTAGSRYGVLLLARVALLVLAGLVLTRLGRTAGTPLSTGRLAALAVLGFALAMTWSGSGHPAAGTLTALALVTDAVHLLAMSVWLGGLAVLSVHLLRKRRAPEDAAAVAVSRFSRWAGAAVVVLGATGLIQAWRELAASGMGGRYVSLLVFKVGAFGLLLWLGALSRSVVRRRLLAPAGTRKGPRAGRREPDVLSGLRRSVRWEVSIAAVVLGLTAALVATPPGGHDHGPAAAATGAPAGPFLGALALPGAGDVQVWVDPARPGNNQIVLNVRDSGGINQDVPDVQAQLRLSDGDVGPLPVALARTGPGQFVGDAVLVPMAGMWRLSLRVRTTDFDETTVEADIPMRT